MFQQIEEIMEEASKALDITSMKLDAYMENAVAQLDINVAEAELKVMKESGTPEDFGYLLEETSNGFVEKVSKVISAMIENIKKFFSAIREKVIEVFTKKEVEVNLNAIEKKVKLNPILRAKKIKCDNSEAEIEAIEEHEGVLKKFIARLKGGHVVSHDELDAENERHASKMKKIAAGVAAGGAVLGILAAVALVKKQCGSIGMDLKSDEKATIDAMTVKEEQLQKCGIEGVNVMNSCLSELTRSVKEKEHARVAATRNTLANILDAVSKKQDSAPVKESADEDVEETVEESVEEEETVEESVEETSETDAYFTALEAELFGEEDSAEEVVEESTVVEESANDTDTLDTFLEELEAELFGEEEEAVTESTDDLDTIIAELQSL